MNESTADWAEQAHADNPPPGRPDETLPVIGIGGSAGGVSALQTFFERMPDDPGMAFIVVMHRPPGQADALAATLRRCTTLPVVVVGGGDEKLQADRIYVVAPGHTPHLHDGAIRLVEPLAESRAHVAIDLFFRTLADTHGPHATVVVLSGDDGDGAIGVKRVKERGGLTVVQDPDEAEHDIMPRTALATGMIDWVLPAAEMPSRLIEYRRIEHHLRLPPEDGPQPTQGPRPADDRDEVALREVLAFLRTRTGRDFSAYKRATTVRRIARRMQVNGVADIPSYLARLRTQPGEVGALQQDLLISVTNFFRDGRCFAALEEQIPSLFREKGPGDRVRAWVAACASGEEAYSLAMLLAEHADRVESPPMIQVFATDLDEQAIQVARSGLYPSTIEADVSPERLRRFFMREHQGYRIRRELRETVLFSLHDVLRDSPFSRLDLISCRNLLIYLTRQAQTRVFDTFHFALRAEGRLFLGTSETVEEGDPLFAVLDKKNRIFVRRAATRPILPVPGGPNTLSLWVDSHLQPGHAPVHAGSVFDLPAAERTTKPGEAGAASWREFHLKLLEKVAPPSLIVDGHHEIVHLSEHAGKFLQFGAGEPTSDLLRLVSPAVRIELRAALFQAAQRGATAEIESARFMIDGHPHDVSIRVTPTPELASEFLLVVFDARPLSSDAGSAETMTRPGDPVVVQLDREVEHLNSRLRDIVEQYEAANEELKASNEELQAMNEELRSATEELETGREELQSINEELTTVNQELKSKVDELGSSNSDMLNLMDATSIPTVFLDRELRIMRYTPAAIPVFNLIPSDTGRPLTDLNTELDFPMLGEDAARVLAKLVPIEREISRAGTTWYLARLLPYRTIDDRIGGVVLTLVDINERRQAETALRESEERLRLIVENARDYAIFSCDLERRVTSWNPGAERLLGYAESEVLGLAADLIFTPEDIAAGIPIREAETALTQGRAGDDRFHQRKDGSLFWASGTMMPMRDASGTVVGFVKILRDQTEARRAQQALERSRAELLQAWHENDGARREAELQKEHLSALFTQAPAPICILRGPEYRVEFANGHMCRLWGVEPEEIADKPMFEAVPGLERAVFKDLLDGVMRTGTPQIGKEVAALLDHNDDGALEERYLNFTYAPLQGLEDSIDGVMVMAFDVTDEIRAREQMSQLHEMAQASGRAKDDFLAMLGHELRNPLAPLRTALHLIRRKGAADPMLDVAERQAGNLARIVDDLLEAARVTEGKIHLRLECVDLATSVRHALEATQEFLAAHRHSVELEVPEKPVWVEADRVRLEQIVVNLLNNAGKYTPDGGHVRISLQRAGASAELRVFDDGIGIAEDLRPRLFQMFQQGDRPLSRDEGGLGIGLNVVRRLVELHHGSVEAQSEGIGKGSVFIVRLPLMGAPADLGPQVAAPAPQPTASTDTGLRVLVVDDNRDAGDTLQILIESLGHQARLATDGVGAMQQCADWEPDVVFLDIGLPGMDGYEVARTLRQRLAATAMPRLVALTGYGQERDREKTRAHGFDDHLVKPADFEAIAAILQQVADHAGAGGAT